jgi:NDP-sugar pyrophosphorylase family protein
VRSRTSALILAGGLGTRLRSVVADRPKVLAEVAGRPFLAHLLDKVARSGVREVVLCTGYLADQVEATFGARYSGLEIRYSREVVQLGTGGALRLALSHTHAQMLLVLNGDSYCTVDLEAFSAWHAERNLTASLALTRVTDTQRYGRVQLDQAGKIGRFDEKGAASGPGWVNAGVYLVARERLNSIPADVPVSLERDVFPRWVGDGLFGYRSAAELLDIGTPASYAQAAVFLAGLRQAA